MLTSKNERVLLVDSAYSVLEWLGMAQQCFLGSRKLESGRPTSLMVGSAHGSEPTLPIDPGVNQKYGEKGTEENEGVPEIVAKHVTPDLDG